MPALVGIRESWERAIADRQGEGRQAYAIPAGASVHPLGGLGYLGFAEKVRHHEAALGLRVDYVIVCTVTGSTHAGVVVGFAKGGRQRRRHRRVPGINGYSYIYRNG